MCDCPEIGAVALLENYGENVVERHPSKSVDVFDTTKYTLIQKAETVIIAASNGNTQSTKVNWDKLTSENSDEVVEQVVLQELQNKNFNADDMVAALQQLVSMSDNYQCLREDILNILLTLMQQHPEELLLQFLSLQVLHNLQKYISPRMHKENIEKLLSSAMSAVENFPYQISLFKIVLSILTDFWECFESKHDQCLKCIKLMFDGLCVFQCQTTRTDAWKIIDTLLQFLDEKQLLRLIDKNEYIEMFFNTIKENLKTKEVDEDLKIVLSLIGLLSFHKSFCHLLLNDSTCMDILLDSLTKFQREEKIVKAILTILGQLIRLNKTATFICKPTIALLLIFASNSDVLMSYLSISILAYTLFYRRESLELGKDLLEKVNYSTIKAIENWSKSTEKFARYESLKLLEKILKTHVCDGLDVYAAWTLWHLCSIDPVFYLKLIADENTVSTLLQCVENEETCMEAITLLNKVIEMFCSSSNTTAENWRSVENIVELLQRNECKSEEEIANILKILNGFLELRSKKNISEVLLSTGKQNLNNRSIQMLVISCLSSIVNNIDIPGVSEMLQMITYSILCSKSFPEVEDITCSAVKLTKTCCENIRKEPIIQLMGFSELDKKSSRFNFDIDFKSILIHFLLLSSAFDRCEVIIENCLDCTVTLLNIADSSVISLLIKQYNFTNRLFSLLEKVCNSSVKSTAIAEKVAIILYQLSSSKEMIKRLVKEHKFQQLVDLITTFSHNLLLVVNPVIMILTQCQLPEDYTEMLEELLHEEVYDVKFKYSILSLLMQNSKRDVEFTELIFKWWYNPVEFIYPVSVLCNHFLKHEEPSRQLYAVWVLTGLLKVMPVQLKRRLLELGDIAELECIKEKETLNEIALVHLKKFLNQLEMIEHCQEEKKVSIDVIKSTIRDDEFSSADDVQRCLHLLRVEEGWLNMIRVRDLRIIFDKLHLYKENYGICREGIALVYSLLSQRNTLMELDFIQTAALIIEIALNNFTGNIETLFYYSILCLDKIKLENIIDYVLDVVESVLSVDNVDLKWVKCFDFYSFAKKFQVFSLKDEAYSILWRDVDINVFDMSCLEQGVLFMYLTFLPLGFYRTFKKFKLHHPKVHGNVLTYLVSVIPKYSNVNEINDQLIQGIYWALRSKSEFLKTCGRPTLDLEKKTRITSFATKMAEESKDDWTKFLSICILVEILYAFEVIEKNDHLIDIMCNFEMIGKYEKLVSILYPPETLARHLFTHPDGGTFVPFIILHSSIIDESLNETQKDYKQLLEQLNGRRGGDGRFSRLVREVNDKFDEIEIENWRYRNPFF